MPSLSACNVNFLELHGAVFCVECELISYNNTDHCLACGSRALFSLSRIMGGSIRDTCKRTALAEELLDHMVAEALSPAAIVSTTDVPRTDQQQPAAAVMRTIARRRRRGRRRRNRATPGR